MTLKQRVLGWVEHRTGLETLVKNFLFEDIPASCGWRNVFGSVAVFLFLVQAFTGMLLAFNFAPTPGDAYNSLRYIVGELTGGELIRGLHHWGASLMIVVVLIHLGQVFLYGAYKRPREAVWGAGAILLLLTMAYGLTGYLLPWDNRAYWGTVVTTQIMGKVPLFGPYLTRFLGSDGGIGVVTFARFYALHVLLLPPLTTLLIVVHVYLVRKHGVAPVPADAGKTKKFFPGQVWRDTLAIFVAFMVLFLLAVFIKVPLERLADPTDTNYIPRPDWYFLFLFQLLKIFDGSLEIFGAVILPTLAILGLFLVPFLDRGQAKALRDRTVAFGVTGLSLVAWISLTLTAVLTTPSPGSAEPGAAESIAGWQQLAPSELAGLGYYRQERCDTCHNLSDGKAKEGPNLAASSRHRSKQWLIEHFRNPSSIIPGTSMPPIHLDDNQLAKLTAFLLKLRPENASSLESAPAPVVEGAMLYAANNCGTCHVTNGEGMAVGPSLNGLISRRSREWIEVQIRHPERHSKEPMMPAYPLSETEMNHLIAYLLALPGQSPPPAGASVLEQ
ncbi:MAG: cytochrome b N-terminal domain-containing protein [Acidobacteriota bacterium]